MAKSNPTRISTRSARSKLKEQHEPYWLQIRPGLYLGYRKGRLGGRWLFRVLVDGNYRKGVIGATDDLIEADNITYFSFAQAQGEAMRIAEQRPHAGPYTVEDAANDYMRWFEQHRKSADRTWQVIRAHILPPLGDRLVTKLTPAEIRQWHEELAKAPAKLRTGKGKPQNVRATKDERPRKATANRVLTVLKAALNHAYHDRNDIFSDDAWKRVKPFRGVDAPKLRFLSQDECQRLINASQGTFRDLVTASLLTGCRYGELTRAQVQHFNPDAGTLYVRESKGGKPRHIPLTEEGVEFFRRQIVGKATDDLIFTHEDERPWLHNHQVRPINEACERAGINPPILFHDLRRTYGAMLAMKSVPLQVIAHALGHADTRVTERHYAHLMPSFVADTVRANLPSFGVGQDNVVSLKR